MLVRLARRMLVCSLLGHEPWPTGADVGSWATGGVDIFCDRCGKVLQEREIVPLPPEDPSVGGSGR